MEQLLGTCQRAKDFDYICISYSSEECEVRAHRWSGFKWRKWRSVVQLSSKGEELVGARPIVTDVVMAGGFSSVALHKSVKRRSFRSMCRD